MKVELKVPSIFNKHHYVPGIHEVPDELAGHWYFLALVANGKVKVLKGPKKAVAVDGDDSKDPLSDAQALAPKAPEKSVAPASDPLAKAVIAGKKRQAVDKVKANKAAGKAASKEV